MSDAFNQENLWPLPKFYFKVSLGSQGSTATFQEVSGLETETQAIEYRHGESKQFSTIKMPEIAEIGNVTLKKGIFVNDNIFWKWFDAIKMNTLIREKVIIQLIDESGKPTMTWTLANAWSVRITGTDLKSDNIEVAVETLEIAHESLTIKNGNSYC